jgi:glycosyltransferase involved in cell wall biosynthesis
MEQAAFLEQQAPAPRLRKSTHRLRVVCAMPYALGTAPGQRFRWEQWALVLRDYGVDFTFVTFGTRELDAARAAKRHLQAARHTLGRLPGWIADLSAARRADVLVVFRNAALAGPPVAELVLARTGVPIVYDFDDAIYLPPETGDNQIRRALRCDWRVGVLARHAALVTVGNPTLAEYVRAMGCRAEIVPTTIHIAAYPQRPTGSSDMPVIGWSGSRTTAVYLEQLLPTLRQLRQKAAFRLVVMGADVDLSGLEGECLPWSEESEVAGLHRMDIGLMPIPDSPWARGKCALKALQYLAVGVPAVVSDVGVNAQAVPHGQCGFVVRTPEEWTQSLHQLLKDPAQRHAFGRAGREHVIQHYSAEAWAPRIAEILKSVSRDQSDQHAGSE